ncbi:glutathione S-transferase [Phyllosticta citrichinensis]|uniref:Glutathione S-transferase n=1 Tax=Phyllosticta citrichinensis TaxID=1130410 RepID=A0ABR1XJ69_9PEZI
MGSVAPFGKLYSYTPSPKVSKILAVAKLNGLDIEVPADFKINETNKTPEFLAKWPAGKVPAFEDAEGNPIADSDAIAQYVAESGPKASQLLGESALERARVRQWICYGEGDIFVPFIPLIIWRFGIRPYDEKVENDGVATIVKGLVGLERHLKGRQWVATDKFSLADISLASSLLWPFAHVIDEKQRTECPNVVSWFERVLAVPEVRETFGEPKYIDFRKVPQ